MKKERKKETLQYDCRRSFSDRWNLKKEENLNDRSCISLEQNYLNTNFVYK